MKATAPDLRPSFETKEQLWELLTEALEDTQEGIEMGSERWKRFREELLGDPSVEKLAS